MNVRAVKAGEAIGLYDKMEGVVLGFVEKCGAVINVNRAKEEFR